ncbi:MAG: DUF421 domain-containing protein, partial [Bacillota bacterium]|nr:DUF421 domain-containing protein [Bacillota bacterium]
TGITIGSIAATLSIDSSVSEAEGLAGLVSWGALSFLVGWLSLKNLTFRALVDGEPSVVILGGEILERNLAKMRYNINDLLAQLRNQQVFSPSEVDLAILETDGQLSILKKSPYQTATKQDVAAAVGGSQTLPVELVIDGTLLDENLGAVGKTEEWLRSQLGQKGIQDIRQVFFAMLDHNGQLFVQSRKARPRA